jgi:DEAD/DEAH box helicase domain-containing protein
MAEIVIDVETKKSFDEVGGRENFHLLDVSIVVAYDYGHDEFIVYRENELDKLADLLCRADRVIGFNTKNFDYNVLQPHLNLNLRALPSLDILEELNRSLGHRVSLDSVASATLGTTKTGDGLKAIRLYREGRIDELASYCEQDVRLTRDIYEYGAKYGKLYFGDRFGGKKEAGVSWKKLVPEEAPLRLPL